MKERGKKIAVGCHFRGPHRVPAHSPDRVELQCKQTRAGGIDSSSICTEAGIRAGFEEVRSWDNLTKNWGTLPYARQTLVREMYECSTRDYESLREKKPTCYIIIFI